MHYSPVTGEWRVEGKSAAGANDVNAYNTYGTQRMNAYKILENTLNLRDVRVYDKVVDVDGTERRVLNSKETTLAQQKQQVIKDAFKDWLWKDADRRQTLVAKYNELFNSTKPREYDGSHLTFPRHEPGDNAAASTSGTRLRASSTAATRCSPTKWARARRLQWPRRRWRPNGWDCAASPCS